MPDIIRSSSVDSTVVATISSVADQSTLNAVSPTVSATVDGLPATITAWAWKVNGATTGITGPTTATPSYTPTAAGAKVITVDVTIDGVVYSSLPEIFTVGPTTLSVSIAAVADQLDLAAATLDSTVTGGVTPYTYAWTVDGATTGISSSTAADPTYTPTTAGKRTAVVTVTDAAGQTAKASVTWTVGTNTGWVRVWKFIPADQADHNFLTGSLTVDGVEVRKTGGTPTTHAISGGVLTIDTTATGAGLWVYPVQAMANPREYEVCWITGVGPEITADGDGYFITLNRYGGAAASFRLEALRTAGVQYILRARAGSADGSAATAGGAQGRVLGLQLSPGRYSARCLYSTTAWSGDGPSPDDLTVLGGTPSGWHTTTDVAPAETTDEYLANNAVGSDPDEIVTFLRDANNRTYTIPGLTYWVRLRPG